MRDRGYKNTAGFYGTSRMPTPRDDAVELTAGHVEFSAKFCENTDLQKEVPPQVSAAREKEGVVNQKLGNNDVHGIAAPPVAFKKPLATKSSAGEGNSRERIEEPKPKRKRVKKSDNQSMVEKLESVKQFSEKIKRIIRSISTSSLH
ncbi:hypothetical protein QAD02_014835 [Eretmocerus hayati]|uniref:Uncharacterized protein n=1 Tax=Eretmocerus hayati TaxID=131215 RepID=A0ACC2P7G5_9HYME|nr:hypothetical protein QAD02_014835 [Eretmocerus hayati]